jgi:hypothetical protein
MVFDTNATIYTRFSNAPLTSKQGPCLRKMWKRGTNTRAPHRRVYDNMTYPVNKNSVLYVSTKDVEVELFLQTKMTQG